MGKATTTSTLERYAKPFLGLVRERAKKEGRDPRDYFLLVPKYNPTEPMMVPRSEGDAIVKLARTPVARAKMARFLAEPCAPTKLLVLLTAGEHVEGAHVNCMMEARDPAAPRYVSQKEKDAAEAYVVRHASAAADAIEEKKGRAKDFVAIGRGPHAGPVIVPRSDAREGLRNAGYGAVLDELDVPAAHEDELLWLYKVGNVPSWSRTQMGPRTEDGGGGDNDNSDAGVGGGIGELGFSLETARDFVKLTQEWLRLGYEAVREIGEEPSAYVSYVQWPPQDGPIASPRVFPRSKVAEELRHLRGTKKYKQLLEHLEGTPCDDVMLALDVAGRDDICVMFRDKDKIPPYQVGTLKATRVDEG